MMWLEDVRCPVTIALSEEDGILPVRAVLAQAQLLTHHHRRHHHQPSTSQDNKEDEDDTSIKLDQDVRVVMWKEFVHGQVLLDKVAQLELRVCMEDQLAGIEPHPRHHPHTARFA